MQGFWIEWGFDEVFSGTIGLDYDRNRDGQLSPQEQELIRRNAFANLSNYHYFTTVHRGGSQWKADRVESFSARLEDDRLYYRFFVPYSIDLSDGSAKASVVIFDHTFYSDIAYVEEQPIEIAGAEELKVDATIRQNRDNPVTYDPVGGRRRGSASNRAAPGKAYPYEIAISMQAP
jgi:ABC-type uncharacterized transport system substrate-binding protein